MTRPTALAALADTGSVNLLDHAANGVPGVLNSRQHWRNPKCQRENPRRSDLPRVFRTPTEPNHHEQNEESVNKLVIVPKKNQAVFR